MSSILKLETALETLVHNFKFLRDHHDFLSRLRNIFDEIFRKYCLGWNTQFNAIFFKS